MIDISENYVGKYCIIRANDAGVWAGVVAEAGDKAVRLSAGRQLDQYYVGRDDAGNQLDGLTGVALHGIDSSRGRISAVVHDVLISGWCQIMPATPKARASIEGAPVFTVK